MIEVRNVTKRYEGKRIVHALRGISFKVGKGEMVATMGPSGCGKSTLLNILGGLDRPSEGAIIIDGIDVSTLDDNALTRIRREKIASLPQVRSTRTLIALSTFKETARIPLDDAAIQNLKRGRK